MPPSGSGEEGGRGCGNVLSRELFPAPCHVAQTRPRRHCQQSPPGRPYQSRVVGDACLGDSGWRVLKVTPPQWQRAEPHC